MQEERSCQRSFLCGEHLWAEHPRTDHFVSVFLHFNSPREEASHVTSMRVSSCVYRFYQSIRLIGTLRPLFFLSFYLLKCPKHPRGCTYCERPLQDRFYPSVRPISASHFVLVFLHSRVVPRGRDLFGYDLHKMLFSIPSDLLFCSSNLPYVGPVFDGSLRLGFIHQ